MITLQLKEAIIEALKDNRANYKTDFKHSVALEINKAQYSRIKKGETEGVLNEAKWIRLARKLNVKLKEEQKWNTVETATFVYVTTQLEMCQSRSISSLFCDAAGIGKSHAAKYYARTHKNVAYIDCAQVKSKQKLVRKIAKELGVGHTGRYADVYEDLVYYINSTEEVLIILDEAGDLQYDAFLELKALWNAVECGWYMMGADGLKEKIRRKVELKKVGYAEILDRYGNDYNSITPVDNHEFEKWKLKQVALVCKANNSKISALKMYGLTNGSLRKVKNEILKSA